MPPSRLVSVPIDIPELVQPIFRGLALYNTGTLTLYKVPVAFVLRVDGSDLMMHPMAVDAGKRIELNVIETRPLPAYITGDYAGEIARNERRCPRGFYCTHEPKCPGCV